MLFLSTLSDKSKLFKLLIISFTLFFILLTLKFKRKSNRSHANQAHYRCPRLRFHLPADETEYFTVFPEIRDYVYCRVKRVHEWGVQWAEE